MLRYLTITDLITVYKMLEIRKSHIHGKGVFSTQEIKENEIFNTTILHELNDSDKLFLSDYHYAKYDSNDIQNRFIALGPPTYYNHSEKPNTIINIKKDDNNFYVIESISLRNIKSEEEITIKYSEEVKFN